MFVFDAILHGIATAVFLLPAAFVLFLIIVFAYVVGWSSLKPAAAVSLLVACLFFSGFLVYSYEVSTELAKDSIKYNRANRRAKAEKREREQSHYSPSSSGIFHSETFLQNRK